jgi:hypothetical protein
MVNGRVLKRLTLRKNDVSQLFSEIGTGSGASFNIPLGDELMETLLLESKRASRKRRT